MAFTKTFKTESCIILEKHKGDNGLPNQTRYDKKRSDQRKKVGGTKVQKARKMANSVQHEKQQANEKDYIMEPKKKEGNEKGDLWNGEETGRKWKRVK